MEAAERLAAETRAVHVARSRPNPRLVPPSVAVVVLLGAEPVIGRAERLQGRFFNQPPQSSGPHRDGTRAVGPEPERRQRGRMVGEGLDNGVINVAQLQDPQLLEAVALDGCKKGGGVMELNR